MPARSNIQRCPNNHFVRAQESQAYCWFGSRVATFRILPPSRQAHQSNFLEALFKEVFRLLTHSKILARAL